MIFFFYSQELEKNLSLEFHNPRATTCLHAVENHVIPHVPNLPRRHNEKLHEELTAKRRSSSSKQLMYILCVRPNDVQGRLAFSCELVCDGGGSPPFRPAPGRGAGVDSLPRCIRPHRRDLPPSSTPASAANRSTHHLGPLINPHRLPHDSIPNLISLLLLFHSLGAQTRHRFASERGGATSRAR